MGVNVEKCSGCGGLFQFLARGVCSPCLEHRESEFAVVRDWVRDNPGSSIGRASDATEIDEGRIAAWVREGRLERYGLNQKSAEEQREDDDRRRRLLAGMDDPTAVEVDGLVEAEEDVRHGMKARRIV